MNSVQVSNIKSIERYITLERKTVGKDIYKTTLLQLNKSREDLGSRKEYKNLALITLKEIHEALLDSSKNVNDSIEVGYIYLDRAAFAARFIQTRYKKKTEGFSSIKKFFWTKERSIDKMCIKIEKLAASRFNNSVARETINPESIETITDLMKKKKEYDFLAKLKLYCRTDVHLENINNLIESKKGIDFDSEVIKYCQDHKINTSVEIIKLIKGKKDFNIENEFESYCTEKQIYDFDERGTLVKNETLFYKESIKNMLGDRIFFMDNIIKYSGEQVKDIMHLGQSALHTSFPAILESALKNNRFEIVEFIIKDIQDSYIRLIPRLCGKTCLEIAVEHKHTKTIELLIEKKIIDKKDKGLLPEDPSEIPEIALETQDQEFIDFLIDKNIITEAQLLIEFVKKGDVEKFNSHIKKDFNITNKDGQALFMAALRSNKITDETRRTMLSGLLKKDTPVEDRKIIDGILCINPAFQKIAENSKYYSQLLKQSNIK